VPFSLLLLYEQAAFIFKDRTVPWKQGAGYATGMILILVSFLFIGKNYTFMAIFSAGIVFLGMSLFYAEIMVRLAFWA